MDAGPGTFLLLLSTVVGSRIIEKKQNCTSQELEECLTALEAIAQREDLGLATTREELKLVCRKLQQGVQCIDDHTFRCFNAVKKRIFNSVVSDSRLVINDLCVEGELQEDYLRYAPCYKNVSTDERKCGAKYRRLATNHGEESLDEGTNVDDQLKIHCCLFTEFVQCQHEFMLRDCGKHADQFFQRHMERMSGSLINEHCAIFTHGTHACELDSTGAGSAATLCKELRAHVCVVTLSAVVSLYMFNLFNQR